MATSDFLAILSLIIATASGIVAYLSVIEQRRLATNVTSFTQLASAEMLLEKHPSLIQLHNVDPIFLEESDISPIELVYLAQSFAASDFYHRVSGDRIVHLTEYRKNLLRHPKVQRAWNRLIKQKFVSPGPFSDAVDDYVRKISPDATVASVKA